MSGFESKLRTRLREGDPGLADALERSWRVAQEEWLPAIKENKGSFNSYPHLRNLELHLERMLFSTCQGTPVIEKIHLSPLELYLLLAGVLFHDIGRANVRKGHSGESGNILRDEKYIYAALDIPRRDIAMSLSRICQYHEDEVRLYETTIEPYGRVRERYVAALVRLADHLDSTTTRVMPEYLRSDDVEIIGRFRRAIKGVHVDFDLRMIYTVLGEDFDRKTRSTKSRRPDIRKCTFLRRKAGTSDANSEYEGRALPYADALSDEARKAIQQEDQFKRCAEATSKWLPQGHGIDEVGFAVITGELKAKSKGDGNRGKKGNDDWPLPLLLAIIARDTYENERSLGTVQRHLRTMGLPLDAWLIELNGHLYTYLGQETYEPILTKNYLREVAINMWKLASGIIGEESLLLSTLSAELRDQHPLRVSTAVRRISVLCRQFRKNKDEGPNESDEAESVWLSDQRWGWRYRSETDPALGDVLKAMSDGLVDPTEILKQEGVQQ